MRLSIEEETARVVKKQREPFAPEAGFARSDASLYFFAVAARNFFSSSMS